jgi:1,4-alpha-glucan branching enzyme
LDKSEKTAAVAGKPFASTLPAEDLELLRRAAHPDPFRVLGPHRTGPADQLLTVRTFQPRAAAVAVLWDDNRAPVPATRIHPDGIFEAQLPRPARVAGASTTSPSAYRLRLSDTDGNSTDIFDPYAFPPVLTEFDLYLMGEGTHYLKYEKLGAHVREIDGISGVYFAVWAPNSTRVSVVGDFNAWDGRTHPMRTCGSSGVWELFIPGLAEGLVYKFEILSRLGHPLALKADPYAFASELRPNTGSVVRNIEGYQWGDAAWMARRATTNWFAAPISIYEVHPGAWRRIEQEDNRWLTYRELAAALIPYVKQMGHTHIELMPIMEHPYDPSWGYQTVGYFAVTSRYGSPADFMYFVDQCHQAGIGVLLDWTPAHFPRDAHGLAFFDGTHLYEHADPRRGAHPDWGTLVFNYGRKEVENFLISNALFWLDKFHADGLRVDAVASMLYLDYSRKPGEWIPNEFGGHENLEAIAFLKHLNGVTHARHPGALVIAEESTSWPAVTRPVYLGGLGFDFKWNMGWMNDILRYIARDPIHRKYHHNELSFSMMYAFTENFVLPFSHDEVVHGKRSLLSKMPAGGDWRHQFAGLRLLYAYQFAHPGKKLLFMGGELAMRPEWSETKALDWSLLDSPAHAGVQRLVADLNRLYTSEPALHQVEFDWTGFEWLDVNDSDASVLTFLRRCPIPAAPAAESRPAQSDAPEDLDIAPTASADFILVVCNFSPVARENYRVAVPQPGHYEEILNTDSSHYGGSNIGNLGEVQSEPVPWKDRPNSIVLRLPPLGALFLKLCL